MLDFNKYEFKYEELNRIEKPRPPRIGDPELYRIYADQLEEYNKKKKIYDDKWKKIIEEKRKLEAQFYPDLIEDLGIKDNPKAEKLFGIAWSHGHASGYEEVYNYAIELVDLIK